MKELIQLMISNGINKDIATNLVKTVAHNIFYAGVSSKHRWVLGQNAPDADEYIEEQLKIENATV